MFHVQPIYLVDVVARLVVFLLVMDEAAAVGPGPGALVALVRVLARVPPPVVDQVVRTLELFATKVASVPELGLVHQLVLFQGVL